MHSNIPARILYVDAQKKLVAVSSNPTVRKSLIVPTTSWDLPVQPGSLEPDFSEN
jgi:hypothetical protein